MRYLFDTKKEHKSLKLVKKLQEEADQEWQKEVAKRKAQEENDEAIAKELQAQLEQEQDKNNPFTQSSSPPPPLPVKPQAYNQNFSSSSLSIAPLYGLEQQNTTSKKKSYLPYKPSLTTRISSPSPVLHNLSCQPSSSASVSHLPKASTTNPQEIRTPTVNPQENRAPIISPQENRAPIISPQENRAPIISPQENRAPTVHPQEHRQKVSFSNQEHRSSPYQETPPDRVYPKSPYHTHTIQPTPPLSMSMPEPIHTQQPVQLHSDPAIMSSFYPPDHLNPSTSAPVMSQQNAPSNSTLNAPPSMHPSAPSNSTLNPASINPAGAQRGLNMPTLYPSMSAPNITPYASSNKTTAPNATPYSSSNKTTAPNGTPYLSSNKTTATVSQQYNPYKTSDSFFALKPNQGKVEEEEEREHIKTDLATQHTSLRSQDSGYDYSDMVYVKNNQMMAENPFADTHAIKDIHILDPTFSMREEKTEEIEEKVRRTYMEKESVEEEEEAAVVVSQVFPTNILRASAPNYGYYQSDNQHKELPKLPQSKNTEDRHITVASLKPGQRVWIRIHPTDTGKMLAERIHIVATYQTRKVTKITTKNGRNIPLDNTPLFEDWNEIMFFEEGEPWTVELAFMDNPYLEKLAEGKEWMKQLKASFKS
ncbi:unnamed protein product [Rhizopus stolonifer]